MKQNEITAAIRSQYERALCWLPPDVAMALECAADSDTDPAARKALEETGEAVIKAAFSNTPLCNEPGVLSAYVFSRDGGVITAVEEGTASLGVSSETVVLPPEGGDKIVLMPRCGKLRAEDKTLRLAVSPSRRELEDAVVAEIEKAAPNLCPPIAVAVGVSKSAETAHTLACAALTRSAAVEHPDESVALTERRIRAKTKFLNIGAMGKGGKNTVMAVMIGTDCDMTGNVCCTILFNCRFARRSEIKL